MPLSAAALEQRAAEVEARARSRQAPPADSEGAASALHLHAALHQPDRDEEPARRPPVPKSAEDLERRAAELDARSPAAPAEGVDEGALWAAAHSGDAAKVRQLLANGADPNESEDKENGRETLSALHWASWKGNAEIVDALLQHGADHGSVNKWGKTPLHWAGWMGHSDVASVLMSHGASAAVLDDDGWTPLHLAARFNHAETVGMLLGSGAEVDIPDRFGQTARELAEHLGYADVVAAIDGHAALTARDAGPKQRTAAPSADGPTRRSPSPAPSPSPGPSHARPKNAGWLSSDRSHARDVSNGRQRGAARREARGTSRRRSSPDRVESFVVNATSTAQQSAYETVLQERYHAQEQLARARVETAATIEEVQRAADERVAAVEQRAAQSDLDALAERSALHDTVERLRQELLEAEAEAASGKAAHSSLLLNRQQAQDALEQARTHMDATVASIQSSADDRVAEAERRLAQLRNDYKADSERMQESADQLRHDLLEATTDAATAQSAHESLRAELERAEATIERTRADMEKSVAAVQKAAEERVVSAASNAQHAASQAEQRLQEERQLKEQAQAGEKSAKDMLAEEKRTAWTHLEDERRKLDEERWKATQLTTQVDALNAEIAALRSTARTAESVEEAVRQHAREQADLARQQRAAQAQEDEVASRLRECTAREDAAKASELRARAEADDAAALRRQSEDAISTANAIRVEVEARGKLELERAKTMGESARAAAEATVQQAEKSAASKVSAANVRLREVLEALHRTQAKVTKANTDAKLAEERALEQANYLVMRAEERVTAAVAQSKRLEEDCQRRLAAAAAQHQESLERELAAQRHDWEGKLKAQVAATEEAQALASKEKEDAKRMLEEARNSIAAATASQADLEEQIKLAEQAKLHELGQAAEMVQMVQDKAQAETRAAERRAESSVVAVTSQLDEAAARCALLESEVEVLKTKLHSASRSRAETLRDQAHTSSRDMEQAAEMVTAAHEKAQAAVRAAEVKAESGIAAVTQQLQEAQARCAAAEGELQSLKAAAVAQGGADHESQLAATSSPRHQITVLQNAEIARLTSERDALVQAARLKSRAVEERLEAEERLVAESAESRRLLDQEQARISALQEELEMLQAENQRLSQAAAAQSAEHRRDGVADPSNARVAELQQQLDQVRDKLQTEQAENQRLSQAAAAQSAEHRRDGVADPSNARVAELQQQLDQVRNELQTEQARVRELELENHEVEEVVAAMMKEQEQVATGVAEIKQASTETETECAARLEAAAAELKRERERVDGLQRENAAAVEAVAMVVQQQQESAEEFERRLADSEREKLALSGLAEIERLSAECAQARTELEQAQSRIQSLELENDLAKESVAAVVEQQEQVARSIEQTGDLSLSLQQPAALATVSAAKLEHAEQAHREDREAMARSLERTAAAEALKLAAAEDAQRKSAERLAATHAELEKVRAECAKARAEVNAQHAVVRTLQLEKEQAEQALEDAYSLIREQGSTTPEQDTGRLRDAVAQAEQCARERDDYRVRLDREQARCAELELDDAQKTRRIEDLSSQLLLAVSEKDALRKAIETGADADESAVTESTTALIDEATAALRDEQQKNSKLHAAVRDEQQQNAALQAAVEQLRSDLAGQLADAQASAAEIRQLRVDLHAAEAKVSAAVHRAAAAQLDGPPGVAVEGGSDGDRRKLLQSRRKRQLDSPPGTELELEPRPEPEPEPVPAPEPEPEPERQPDLTALPHWTVEPSPPRQRSPEPMPLSEHDDGSSDQEEAEETHDDRHAAYCRVLRPAQLRSGFERHTPKVGFLPAGSLVEVLERRSNRVRSVSGWLSETAGNGVALLEPLSVIQLRDNPRPSECPLLFRARHAASVREAADRNSQRLPDLALSPGEIVEAVEGESAAGGATRWLLRGRGWASEIAASGTVLLEPLGRLVAASSGGDEGRRRAPVWETNRATHTQATALHYTPSEMVHAAEDAAMQVIHDAMRSKRTVFGHSLRDTYAAFKAMDRDGSGQLSLQEFAAAFRRLDLGLSVAQVEEVFRAADEDGSGEVCYAEFATQLWHEHGSGPGSRSSEGR